MRIGWLLLLIGSLLLAAASPMLRLRFVTHGPVTAKTLYRVANVPLPAWYEFWKKREPKVSKIVIDSLEETLTNYFRSEGFYHAKISRSERNGTVTFTTWAGPPARVRDINISGDLPIGRWVTFRKGERFSAQKFVSIKKRIKRILLERGYCNALLDTKAFVDIVKNSVDLRFHVQKNRPCRFGKITIHAPEGISEKVVRSRLMFDQNETYSLKKLNKSYSTISGLEAFDGIRIEQHKHDHTIDLDIDLQKKHAPIRETIGIGYETDVGPRGTLHWEQRNFKGDAKKLSFDLKYSKKEKYLQNTFFIPAFVRIPYLHDRYLDFKNGFSFAEVSYENFDERSIREKLHLLKDFDRFSIDFGLGIEHTKITKTAAACNVIAGEFFMVYPFGKLIVDHRDSKIDPHAGYYYSIYMEGGVKQLFSESSYTKLFAEARKIDTFGGTTVALKAKIGLINEIEKEIPESKLLFSGGAFSNRGYGYNRLGATDASCDGVGGRTMLEASAELTHHLFRRFWGALFFDSTMLSANSFTFTDTFVNSVGTGIRYMTPVGPLKFDIGMDLKHHDRYALHFLIGQSY